MRPRHVPGAIRRGSPGATLATAPTRVRASPRRDPARSRPSTPVHARRAPRIGGRRCRRRRGRAGSHLPSSRSPSSRAPCGSGRCRSGPVWTTNPAATRPTRHRPTAPAIPPHHGGSPDALSTTRSRGSSDAPPSTSTGPNTLTPTGPDCRCAVAIGQPQGYRIHTADGDRSIPVVATLDRSARRTRSSRDHDQQAPAGHCSMHCARCRRSHGMRRRRRHIGTGAAHHEEHGQRLVPGPDEPRPRRRRRRRPRLDHGRASPRPPRREATRTTVDDSWRQDAAAVCAAYVAENDTPPPDIATAGIVAFVDFFRQQRERLPSLDEALLPELLRTAPSDRPCPVGRAGPTPPRRRDGSGRR